MLDSNETLFISPGTEAGIRLYLSEIVSLVSKCLESQSWSVKSQAARAMATVAKKLGGQLTQPHLSHILDALLNGLGGRTWKGKVLMSKQKKNKHNAELQRKPPPS